MSRSLARHGPRAPPESGFTKRKGLAIAKAQAPAAAEVAETIGGGLIMANEMGTPGGYPQPDLEDDDEVTTGTTLGTDVGTTEATTTGDGHPPRTNE
jgi:hypothetical protein